MSFFVSLFSVLRRLALALVVALVRWLCVWCLLVLVMVVLP